MHAEFIKWTNIKYKLIRKKDSAKTWVKKGTLQVIGKYLYWLFLLLIYRFSLSSFSSRRRG